MDPSTDVSLPVTLLTGFLGAGKTTLLNRVLGERSTERYAVVVNEFGEMGVDGELVVGAAERLVQLANGCVCCTVRGDLQAALGELLSARERRLFGRRDFDRVLIEASGLAEPGPIVQTLAAVPGLRERLRLDGVLALAHAVHLPRQLAETPEAREQLAYADRVLLNHVDRATQIELVAARSAVESVNPLALVHETRFADAPLGELLDLRTTDDAAWKLPAAGATHQHASEVVSVGLESRSPLDFDALKIWLQFLASRRGQDIYRIKGILRCAGRAERVVVQGMYEWLELGPSPEPAPERSVLVLIGKHLDRAELLRGWRAAGGDPC